jgi:hypothetical protein
MGWWSGPLGNGLSRDRTFIGTRVNQNHFQRRLLKKAVERLRIDKAH